MIKKTMDLTKNASEGFHVYCGPAYSFQIFQSHQQGMYSRVSGSLGQEKGITLLGTGDFTHPAWRQELHEKLQPAEPGLYTLKEAFRLPDGPQGGRSFHAVRCHWGNQFHL